MEKIASRILLWAALATAISALAGGGYALANRYLALEQRVAANTTTIQQDQWINLNRLKAAGVPLTRDQWTRWCTWGLRYRFIENCGELEYPEQTSTATPRPRPRLWRR